MSLNKLARVRLVGPVYSQEKILLDSYIPQSMPKTKLIPVIDV